MSHAQINSLITGGNITRWTSLNGALEQRARQPYATAIVLGCDGRYWVPATPRIARRLIAAGYEPAL